MGFPWGYPLIAGWFLLGKIPISNGWWLRMARGRRRACYSLVSSIKDIVGESFIEDDADDQQKGDRNAMSDSKQTQTKIDTTFERPTETAKKHIHTRTHKQRYRRRRTHTHGTQTDTTRTHTQSEHKEEDTYTHTHTGMHRHTCTQRGRRIHKLNRPFYTPTLLHTNPFTHRRFCTQMLLHTDAFTRKPFYTQKLSPQFSTLDHHFARKGSASTSQIAISPHFLTLDHHFVQKGCAQACEIATLLHVWTSKRTNQSSRPPMQCHVVMQKVRFCLSFWRSNLISCERDAPDPWKSQFYLSFWRSNFISRERVSLDPWKSQFYLSFLRSNFVSCERVVAAHSKSQFHFSFWRSNLVWCENRNFTSVFGDRSSFRAKELPPRL